MIDSSCCHPRSRDAAGERRLLVCTTTSCTADTVSMRGIEHKRLAAEIDMIYHKCKWI
jgi:hypothetical protein